MRFLIFDQNKIYTFVFSVDYLFTVKEDLENFICNKYINVPSIFCENFKNLHVIVFFIKNL